MEGIDKSDLDGSGASIVISAGFLGAGGVKTHLILLSKMLSRTGAKVTVVDQPRMDGTGDRRRRGRGRAGKNSAPLDEWGCRPFTSFPRLRRRSASAVGVAGADVLVFDRRRELPPLGAPLVRTKGADGLS